MKTNHISLECGQQKRNLSRKTQTSVYFLSQLQHSVHLSSEFTALFWCCPKYTEVNGDVLTCTVTSRSVIIQSCYFSIVSYAVCSWPSSSKLVVYRCQHFHILRLGKREWCTSWAEHESRKFSFWKKVNTILRWPEVRHEKTSDE